MGTFKNNNIATGNSRHTHLDANNANWTENEWTTIPGETSTFAKIFAPVAGAAGSIAGAGLNYLMNSSLQENQFQNQKELQDRAFRMNEQAVRNQPLLQVNGMQAAGLNPASINGAGAPSIQAGAAAGATSQLANIFTGVAELIAAVKAPTEIEKMVAETGKIGTEIPEIQANTEKLKKETDKIFEETVSAKNANQVWESTNNFYKTYAPSMFDEYKQKLVSGGIWDSLADRTKETIDGLIDGSIELDMGGAIALSDLIAKQAQISETDKAMLQNALEGTVLAKQLKNEDVIKALEAVPVNVLKDMQENWKTQRSTRLTQAEQRKLIKEQASGKNIENIQKELNDFNYLIKKGRYKDAGIQILRRGGLILERFAPVIGGAIIGNIWAGPAGAGAGAAVGTLPGLLGNDAGL